MRQRFAPGLFCLTLLGCAATQPLPPPRAESADATAPSAEPASPAKPNAESSGLAELPPGVPLPPDACAPFAGAAPSSCPDGAFRDQLAQALAAPAPQRDLALRCLERASEAPPGLMRALRAELAPRGCADQVLESGVSPSATREIADAELGLAVGARLFRSVRQPPLLRPPFDKAAFLDHFKRVLSPWIAAQAHAVDLLSRVGPRLRSYGKAVVALEAGLADMRFVEVARAVELPEEMKNDAEIRETYLVALEQALEPRVARGRDAALVGLGELSRLGITHDERLTDARRLLSELFAGRRINALDRLLLPALPPLATDSAELKVAAQLPAFYLPKVLPAAGEDAALLRARLEQGVAPAELEQLAAASPDLSRLKRRAWFQLGQTYFWAEAFTRAAAVAAPADHPEGTLLVALAKALARGPKSAAALMLGPPTLPAELRETDELDALAAAKGPLAGLAEFDAAYVRGLAPPANDPAFWKDESRRFRSAEQKLTPQLRQAAKELAAAAADTERALRQAAHHGG